MTHLQGSNPSSISLSNSQASGTRSRTKPALLLRVLEGAGVNASALVLVLSLVIFGLPHNAQAQTSIVKQGFTTSTCGFMQGTTAIGIGTELIKITMTPALPYAQCDIQIPSGYHVVGLQGTLSLSSCGCFGETLSSFDIDGSGNFYPMIVKTRFFGGAVNQFVNYSYPVIATSGRTIHWRVYNWQLQCHNATDWEFQGALILAVD